jgi:eukaryotic-like serine/threonine-protein kinase
MGISGERMLRQCEELGIVVEVMLREFESRYGSSLSAKDMAEALVRSGLLTAYQAGELKKSNGDKLVWDGHVIVDRLGKGGMGQVFRARHREKDKHVALKTILDEDERGRIRFLREIDTLSKFDHPNVVKYLGSGEDHESLYLVMELIQGRTLSEYRESVGGRLGLRDAVRCVLEAARGLSHSILTVCCIVT